MRYAYTDHNIFAYDASVKNIVDIDYFPPHSLVTELTDFFIDDTRARLVSSWYFSFSVPEGQNLNKLVVPELAEIDLKNVLERGDIRLSIEEPNLELPVTFNVGNFATLTISNPRWFEHPDLGNTLAFDVDIENIDSSQREQVFYVFSLVDKSGALSDHSSTQCGDPERDDVFPWPFLNIHPEPGQTMGGVVCLILDPGVNDEVRVMWIWNIVEEINPNELGLDTDRVMEINGIQVRRIHLRINGGSRRQRPAHIALIRHIIGAAQRQRQHITGI